MYLLKRKNCWTHRITHPADSRSFNFRLSTSIQKMVILKLLEFHIVTRQRKSL